MPLWPFWFKFHLVSSVIIEKNFFTVLHTSCRSWRKSFLSLILDPKDHSNHCWIEGLVLIVSLDGYNAQICHFMFGFRINNRIILKALKFCRRYRWLIRMPPVWNRWTISKVKIPKLAWNIWLPNLHYLANRSHQFQRREQKQQYSYDNWHYISFVNLFFFSF